MPGLYTGASGLWGGFAGLLYGSTSLSTPPGLLADAAGFSPSSLFANGEQGVWYQNSDFSTLFQDAAGTTPVTALEQPVGLRLDKSKGLVLGSELVTNGDFSSNTWWSTGGGAAISGGALNFTAAVVGSGAYRLGFATVGKYYELTFEIISISSGGIQIGLGNSYGTNRTAAGVYTQRILCTGNGNLTLYSVGASTTASVDNVSIKEVQGNHAFQTTISARPVLSSRYNLLTQTEAFENAAWSKNNISPFGSGSVVDATTSPIGTNTADLIRENNTSGEHYVSQQATKPGASIQYTLVCSVKRATAGTRNFGLGITDGTTGGYAAVFNPDTGAVVLASQGIGTTTGWSIATPSPGVNQGNGWWQFSITVTTNTSTRVDGVLYLFDGTTRTYIGDNTSNMYIWGADLRAASESPALPAYQRVGAATYGTSTSVGNPDYDTVGFPPYLIYDGGDWFQTNSINFTATDKMSVFAGVRKLDDAGIGVVAELSADVSTNNGSFRLLAPNSGGSAGYQWLSRGTTLSIADALNLYPAPITNVLTGLSYISTDIATIRINSLEVTTSTTDQGTGNYGNYPLYIGARGAGAAFFFKGRDYGFVIVGRAVTASELTNTEDYMDVQTFGKNMTLVYSDELTTALGELITAADGDQIYMSVSYV